VRDPRQFHKDLSPVIADLLTKAYAPTRSARFPTAAVMSYALQGVRAAL
jgi:hypothetical protein